MSKTVVVLGPRILYQTRLALNRGAIGGKRSVANAGGIGENGTVANRDSEPLMNPRDERRICTASGARVGLRRHNLIRHRS